MSSLLWRHWGILRWQREKGGGKRERRREEGGGRKEKRRTKGRGGFHRAVRCDTHAARQWPGPGVRQLVVSASWRRHQFASSRAGDTHTHVTQYMWWQVTLVTGRCQCDIRRLDSTATTTAKALNDYERLLNSIMYQFIICAMLAYVMFVMLGYIQALCIWPTNPLSIHIMLFSLHAFCTRVES